VLILRLASGSLNPASEKKALWVQTGILGAPSVEAPAPNAEPRKLTIDEAKRGIAAALGISTDAIEIIIRT
jgi:hypothetical protein